jgi:hypothetical protein
VRNHESGLVERGRSGWQPAGNRQDEGVVKIRIISRGPPPSGVNTSKINKTRSHLI